MSNRNLRVAILAHSFSSAYRIFRETKIGDSVDLSIILSPSPHRSAVPGFSLNLFRVFVGSVLTLNLEGLRMLASGKLILLSKQFDHDTSIARLKELRFDIGLHKAGIIYRARTIAAFRLGILNPHIGLLPEYRGRSVMEWSLLKGDPVGITVFFIDEGIDTGERIVVSEPVDVSSYGSVAEAKGYLFNLDAVFFRKALEAINSGSPFLLNNGMGRRYYVMSNLFTGVVEELLRKKAG